MKTVDYDKYTLIVKGKYNKENIIMFNFFDMIDTYDNRKVDNFTKGKLVVDTVAVTDGAKPYETGIQHPDYTTGDEWIIVEAYADKVMAKIGHDKWVKKMTAKKLPSELRDCQNSTISSLLDSKSLIFKRKQKQKVK